MQWTKQADSGAIPGARSSHSATAIGQKVYVFSGENKPGVSVGNDLFCYDLDLQAWNVCRGQGSVPKPRVGHAAAAVGSKLYVFGGRTGIEMGEGLLDDLQVYDLDKGVWSEVKATGDKPCGRSYHAMTSHGKKIYLFGGCAKTRLNDLFTFDAETAHWTKMPTYDVITPRGGPGLAVVGSHVYVIAGFAGEEVSDMYKFDIETNKWETLPTGNGLPPISVFGCTTIQKKIMIFGGEVKPSTEGHAGAGAFSNNIYIFDTERTQNGWVKMPISGDRPSPRGWLPSTTTSKGQIVVHGGLSPDNTRLGDLWVLNM